MDEYKVSTFETDAPNVVVDSGALPALLRFPAYVAMVFAFVFVAYGFATGKSWAMSFGYLLAAIGALFEAAAWRSVSGHLAGALFVSMGVIPDGSVRLSKVERN